MENKLDSAVTTEETTEVTTNEVDEEITLAEGDGEEVEEEFTEEETEETEKEEVETEVKEKPKQSKEKNKEFAEKRRAEKLAKEEAELSVLKEYVGTNPYTGEPIETLRDAKVYKTMKMIEKQGGDPVTDYHKYAGLEEQKAIDTENERKESIRKDVEEFKKAFPDVNLNELSKDANFVKFSNKFIGKVPLKDIYEAFSDVKSVLKVNAEETAKQEVAKKIAKEKTSVGNLEAVGDANAPMYTLEQIGKMTNSELDKNWKEVEKSYNYWQTHKRK